MIFISVIIPCFNAEKYIEASINSVLNQTYSNYEIICIDNNSTDNTWNILLGYAKKYNTIFIEKENKQGASCARNKGLKMAKGTWIQFLDADDILYQDKFERQVNLLKENTRLVAGAFETSINNQPPEQYHILDKDYWSLLIISGLGNTVSNFWNKKTIEDAGYWNEEYTSSQEYELMFRILKHIDHKDIVIDNQPSMLYNRRLTGSISNNYEKNTIKRIQLRKSFKDYFLQSNRPGKKMLLENVQNFIFKDLRFLYTLNPAKAIELYLLVIDKTFFPEVSFVTPWYYNASFKILGFNFTEKLFSLKRKLFFKEQEHHF